MKKNNIKCTLSVTLAVSLFSLNTYTAADDTEVFLAKRSKPNLLFIMDLSGSMAWSINASGSTGYVQTSRFDVMKDAVNTVLNEAPDDINIGIMNYGPGSFSNTSRWLYRNENKRSHAVHGVAFPISGINELAKPIVKDYLGSDNLPNPNSNTTVRTYLSDIIDSWQPRGGTPIVDSLVEASRYFAGDKVVFGQDIPSSDRAAHPSTYEGDKITIDLRYNERDLSTAPNYKSPISDGCQENFIMLLSDGEPTYYYRGQGNSRGKGKGPFASYMKGNGSYGTVAAGINGCVDSPNGFFAGTCGPEVTSYMATHDINPSIDGDQHVKVFTIGYAKGVDADTQSYLKSLVTVDDDPDTEEVEGYYSADDNDSLKEALKQIISDVAASAESVGSPTYSVNVLNGLEHEDEIYIPLFSKASGVRWSGNLKKFAMVPTDASTDVTKIQGKNNLNAFDEDGKFTNSALDFWSNSTAEDPDGAVLEKGGVANLLNPNTRNLFSNINCGSSSCDLNTDDNLISTDNDNLNDALLGISDDDNVNRNALINFIRGKDIDGSPRYHMGDILHSEPLVVTYNASSNDNEKKQYVFVGTNEGYLHAFDTATGEEVFAFMPKELLVNIKPQYYNLDGSHIYGIDGALSYWQDADTNKRYLYFGMRRGGTAYYALDVTDINNPKFLWEKSADNYPSMGQSWSPPYLGRVGVGEDGVKKEVVIISGGYDPVEDRNVSETSLELDNASSEVNTTMGKDILVLDAKTGTKVWSLRDSIGTDKVQDSIPGGVKILDTNHNGMVDRMYFADTGGNVWRLDLSEIIGDEDAENQLVKLASLGGSGKNSRKFYMEPEVASLTYNGKALYVVTIGSGFRAHTLDTTIDDKFFILIDDLPFEKPGEGFTTIQTSNLAKSVISSSGSDVSVSTEGSFYADDKRGWMVSLPEFGEKVLTKSVVRNGVVMFTSFVPQSEHSTGCTTSNSSVSHLYGINIITGKSGVRFDELKSRNTLSGSSIDINDASPRLSGSGYPGIVPPPETVFGSFEVDEDGVCKHSVDYRLGRKLTPVSGYSACELESVYWSNPVSKGE